jgi:hypothetical protein
MLMVDMGVFMGKVLNGWGWKWRFWWSNLLQKFQEGTIRFADVFIAIMEKTVHVIKRMG